jgi:hypothetical protein
MLAQARPDLERKIGVTAADSPSPDYQFSEDRIAWPSVRLPTGWPCNW